MKHQYGSFMSEKKASIDIGSNSALLLAAEVEKGQILNVLANESRVTGLGRGLDESGRFMEIAMQETYEALSEYVSICSSLGILPSEIFATATEASRVSSNSKAFFAKFKEELGINVQIITGEQEAEFSTKGALLGADKGRPHSIMDIGGASTEFIAVNAQGDNRDGI